MAKRQFVLGIDGGGTKTTAILADFNGNVVAEANEGPTHAQIVGVDKAVHVLFRLVEHCCKLANCSIKDVGVVLAGIAGAGRIEDQERMVEGIRAYAKHRGASFDEVVVESDARIALEGAFKGQAGIVLISGTGSIAFGKDFNGQVHRVGGWGRLLGDEGSGFAIGREGLNIVTKHLDGRIKETMLTKLVAQKFQLGNHEQIIAAVYGGEFDLAAIAPLVIEASAKHDLECGRILNRATFELSEHVRSLTLKIEAASRGRARQKIPLAFIGTVLSTDTIFSRILKHKITSTLPQIMIVQPQSSPAYGAVLMGIGRSKR